MKTISRMVLMCILITTYDVNAQSILIADNNPGAVAVPGQVFVGGTALQDAIVAAVDDDIIQVIRSTNSYGAITIDKRLNIFGIGLNPDTPGGLRTPVPDITIADPAASGTRVSGLVVSTGFNLGGVAGALNNLLIENCDIYKITHTTGATDVNNIIIRNNIIGENFGAVTDETIHLVIGSVTNAVITNNVIYGSTRTNSTGSSSVEGFVTADQAVIDHNLFVANDNITNYWRAFDALRNCVVRNNIFFGVAPRGISGTIFDNDFINNISWLTDGNTFLTSDGNTSTGNFANVDPMLTNVPIAFNAGSLTNFDPTVSGTEAVNGGTDGTDIGVTGGAIPFSLEGTLIPNIQVLEVPPMVIEGNTLDVHIEAKGN